MLHVMTYSRISFWEWLKRKMCYREEKKKQDTEFSGVRKRNYGEIVENSHQSSVNELMSQS